MTHALTLQAAKDYVADFYRRANEGAGYPFNIIGCGICADGQARLNVEVGTDRQLDQWRVWSDCEGFLAGEVS